MDKNILVLGSNSPSGAAFSKVAAKQGHKVFATSRSEEPDEVFLPYKWFSGLDVSFSQLDINKDIDNFVSLAKRENVHWVVNFASQSMVGQSWQYPEHWMQTNVVGQVKLLEALRQLDRLEKYIHFSTPEVYGSTPDWMSESTHYAPSTPYASSRAAGDLNVKLWADTYHLPNIITRAANIYGAGQQLYRIIPKTFLSCMLGRKLPLHGGGLSERAFVHIDDVAYALLAILSNSESKGTYHISPKEKISIKHLVEKICEITNVAYHEVVAPSEDRLGKDKAYLLDSKKIADELQWSAKIGLARGLQEVHEWCERNINRLATLPTTYNHKP